MKLRSSLVRATLLGLIILGIGGRVLMRVAAHMEGRAPAFTIDGTVAVIFWGTVAGAFAGIIYYVLVRFVANDWARTAAFLIICGLVSWRGVRGLLPVQQMMFLALALSYLVIVDLLGRRARAHGTRTNPDLPLTAPG